MLNLTNLSAVLDGRGIREDLRTRFPVDRKAYTNDYDYEDDSDLEEADEEDVSGDDEDDVIDGEPAAAPSGDVEEPAGVIRVGVEEVGDGSDDVVSIGSSDTKSSEPSEITSVSDLDSSSVSSGTKGDAETSSFAHVGKVVVIEGVAFITSVGFISSRCAH